MYCSISNIYNKNFVLSRSNVISFQVSYNQKESNIKPDIYMRNKKKYVTSVGKKKILMALLQVIRCHLLDSSWHYIVIFSSLQALLVIIKRGHKIWNWC